MWNKLFRIHLLVPPQRSQFFKFPVLPPSTSFGFSHKICWWPLLKCSFVWQHWNFLMPRLSAIEIYFLSINLGSKCFESHNDRVCIASRIITQPSFPLVSYWYLLASLGMTLSSQLPKLQPFVDPVNSKLSLIEVNKYIFKVFQLLFASFLLISVGLLFVSLAHFFFKYRDNLGAAVDGSRRKNAHQGGLAEKLEDTLRASMARLPTKKVIRLWEFISFKLQIVLIQ